MVRRSGGVSFASIAVGFGLLYMRFGCAFTARCSLYSYSSSSSNSARTASSCYSSLLPSQVSPEGSSRPCFCLGGSSSRNSRVGSSRRSNSGRSNSNISKGFLSGALQPLVISGAQPRRARHNTFSTMSSCSPSPVSSSCAQLLTSKLHRNTFLLPNTSQTQTQTQTQLPPQPPTSTRENAATLTDGGIEPSIENNGNGSKGNDGNVNDDGPLALVILNTKGDNESKSLLRHLWAKAKICVCADGGANRLHDSFEGEPPEERARFVPDVIVGDLDSLRPEVAAFYEGLGSEIAVRPDQDHNDFEKCLIEVQARLPAQTASDAQGAGVVAGGGEGASATMVTTGKVASPVCAATVVGLGAFGGRFDHEMAGISILHTYTSRFRRLVLIGAGNVAFLLLPGLSHVMEPQGSFEGPTVGLIPVGGACRSVTTEGLQWNLEDGCLEFGVLVSSSNCVVAKEVRVTTDAPLVWTVEFKIKEWLEAISNSERNL